MILVVILLVTFSCTTTQSLPSGRIGGGSQVSWAFYFDNLSDLCTHSDVIAIGVIDKIVEVEHVQDLLYKTRWAFRVEKILKGKETTELIVNQTGAPDHPGSDIMDDPLFLSGERYLLFLRGGTKGTYHNFGPCGRYMIWDDKVYSMNHILLPAAGYQAPSELDFNGVDLDTLVGNILELVESVQLIFTRGESRLQADVLRYSAGTMLDIDVTLSTGNNGPGKVTYKINKAAFPEGLEVSIRPIEFTAYPQDEYKSRLIIMTAPELAPGSYQITLEYDFEGVGSGNRTLTLNVNPVEIPQIE